MSAASFGQSPDKPSNAVEPQASTVGRPRVVRDLVAQIPDSTQGETLSLNVESSVEVITLRKL